MGAENEAAVVVVVAAADEVVYGFDGIDFLVYGLETAADVNCDLAYGLVVVVVVDALA